MKKITISIFVFIGLFYQLQQLQAELITGGRAPLKITETDGSPIIYPTTLEVPNGSLTQNGSKAILTYGGSVIWERVSTNHIVLKQKPFGTELFWKVSGNRIILTKPIWWNNRDGFSNIVLR